MQQFNDTQIHLLRFLSAALFGKEIHPKVHDWKALYREAGAHKVFPIVFDVSKTFVTDEALLQKAAKHARRALSVTVNINYTHADLGRVMEQAHIPYVSFKGLASALYYPKPELRTGGDVDFYVASEDFERTEKVLSDAGYTFVEDGGKHVVYQKNDVFFEMHRTLNGIPDNALGDRIRADVFGGLLQSAREYDIGQGVVKIPDTYHHGMILLLHTLSHMLKEGIGLRHLCDLAVFAASLSEEEFCSIFEKRLKEYGLWRFACLLSLCANRYLGAPYKAWQGRAEDTLLEKMMCDIMSSGNFGEKDADRKRQIKYISDRGEYTHSERSVIAQVRNTLNKKAAKQQKSKAAVLMEYLKNVTSGKRKLDTAKTLEGAAQRKAVYQEFHLFESEEQTDEKK